MAAIVTKFVDGDPSGLSGTSTAGLRRIKARFSSSAIDRSGDIVEQRGIDTTNFMKNPIVLLNHDKTKPVGAVVECGIGMDGNLCGTIQFPDPGVSRLADEVFGLVRAKIYNGISIGFSAKIAEPIDRANPKRGTRYRSAELWEVSIVSVPAVPDALIYERGTAPKAWQPAGVEKYSAQDAAKAQVRMMDELQRLKLAGDDTAWRAADLAILRETDPGMRVALLEIFIAAGLDPRRFNV